MQDNKSRPQTATDDGGTPPAPPPAARVRLRLLRLWVIGLVFFGYGPAFTYGVLTWLLNDRQWGWTYLMYCTLVPVVGGLCVIVLPYAKFAPVLKQLQAWQQGEPVDPKTCADVYLRAMGLPWHVAVGAATATSIGYVGGTAAVHWMSNQPLSEIIKTLPAIPLVSGMMGAFCYVGSVRALHPVVAWCSRQLGRPPGGRHVPMAVKFLTMTCVLATAILCLLLPAAYTLGQRVTEEHLQDRALTHLRLAAQQAAPFPELEDRMRILQHAVLGPRGYIFASDEQGRILSRHPRRFTRIEEEAWYRPEVRLREPEGVWVDRVGQHRVIAFLRLANHPMTFISVAFLADFSQPLRHFVLLSLLVIVEVLVVILVFGRYYVKGVTTPLGELMTTAERIARHGNLAQRVPVTTNDEIGDLARSFNRMIEELQSSKSDLEGYTQRLEQTTRDLSALNQEMEDLLHVVSHDLRAPLINIQGFSKRLEQEASSLQADARFSESLRFIAKGVEKMDALLSSLLAISRVGRKADPVRPHDLDAILDDVLATFDHQLKERTITVLRHPLPKAVPCRRNELNQVLSNLLSNAINYMGASDRRCIEIGGRETAETAEVYVRDTGVGIAPEDQERVFGMFTRLQAVDVPGEGVGLAYVRKIIRSHGGSIRVESARGQGSTFMVTLPTGRHAAAMGG